jgi:1-acyl-sn-glycerol-3-phosphate acyltransferase
MKKKPFLPVIRFLVPVLTRFHIVNPEYISPTGGFLLTTNHVSRLDTPLLIPSTEREDVVAIVAKKYQKKPLFRWLLDRIGNIIWMDREKTDFSAIRQALNHLREGHIVGIAPEGTRSKDSTGLLEGKQGAAVLAARAKVPILPVGIIGSDKVYQNWLRLRRPPITIRFGKPYELPAIDMEDREAWLNRYTDEIMCRIAALLPPSYRGFYADHPRLQELLDEQDVDDLSGD